MLQNKKIHIAYLKTFLQNSRKDLFSFLVVVCVLNFVPYFTHTTSFFPDRKIAAAPCSMSASLMLSLYFSFSRLKSEKRSGKSLLFKDEKTGIFIFSLVNLAFYVLCVFVLPSTVFIAAVDTALSVLTAAAMISLYPRIKENMVWHF